MPYETTVKKKLIIQSAAGETKEGKPRRRSKSYDMRIDMTEEGGKHFVDTVIRPISQQKIVGIKLVDVKKTKVWDPTMRKEKLEKTGKMAQQGVTASETTTVQKPAAKFKFFWNNREITSENIGTQAQVTAEVGVAPQLSYADVPGHMGSGF